MNNIDPTKAKELLFKDRRTYLERLKDELSYCLSQNEKGNFTQKDWEDFAVEALQAGVQEIRRVNGAIQYLEACEHSKDYPRFKSIAD